MLDEQNVRTEPVPQEYEPSTQQAAELVDPAGGAIGAVILQVPDEHADRPRLLPKIATISAKGIPVIALLPSGRTEWMRQTFLAGAFDCLMEPVCDADLIHTTLGALRSRDNTSESRNHHWGGTSRQRQRNADAFGGGTSLWAGLITHRSLLDRLAAIRSTCQGADRSTSIIMVDLDRFRECNEQYSPGFGDQVLLHLASILRRICHKSDVIAHDHADRFIVAVSDGPMSRVRTLASRLRQAVRLKPFEVEDTKYDASISIGMAHSTDGFIETEQQLIDQARLALDFAKKLGGDRISVWDDLINGPMRSSVKQERGPLDEASWIHGIRQHLRYSYLETTRALVAAIEARDPYTKDHSVIVSHYAEIIAKRMKLQGSLCRTIRAAALLHDVGKIGIPDAILTKPGPLTDDEFEIIKRHPQTGLDILEHVSFLAEERPLILHHHERFDGRGYPAGLKGEEIPIGARVLAVADAIDAMLSPRTYKPAFSTDRVLDELRKGAGSQFDPRVTEKALQWLEHKPAHTVSLTLPRTVVEGSVPSRAILPRSQDPISLRSTVGSIPPLR